MVGIRYIRCEIEASASKIILADFLSFPSTAFYRYDGIPADQILETDQNRIFCVLFFTLSPQLPIDSVFISDETLYLLISAKYRLFHPIRLRWDENDLCIEIRENAQRRPYRLCTPLGGDINLKIPIYKIIMPSLTTLPESPVMFAN